LTAALRAAPPKVQAIRTSTGRMDLRIFGLLAVHRGKRRTHLRQGVRPDASSGGSFGGYVA
jgi:hypothetical protein